MFKKKASNFMRKDLTGQRFGKLTALEPAGMRRDNVLWLCECDCGNTCTAPTAELVRGRVRSCGCLKHKSHALDLTGQRFGSLTAIERAGTDAHGCATWLCACDCGNTCVVKSTLLKQGRTRSCGCLRASVTRNDLTGQRFGKLVALKQAGRKHGYVLWECQCDCGNTKLVTSHQLKSGSTRSCGCLSRGRTHTQPAKGDKAAMRAANLNLYPGKRFGDVVAVGATDELRDGSPLWRCVNDDNQVEYLSAVELTARANEPAH